MLNKESQSTRKQNVGFYHRNTSQQRKEEILGDLKLPINSPSKQLQCVIATVSLGKKIYPSFNPLTQMIHPGVGVDIRVDNTVVIGLSETMEDLLQEGGRSMRGGLQETQGRRGYSFFLHKGSLGRRVKTSSDTN